MRANPRCRARRTAHSRVHTHLRALCAGVFVLLCARAAAARELWQSDDSSYALSLDSALKATWLVSRAPDDPVLFPERTTETGLFRLRLSLDATLGEHVDSQVSYEHRARVTSDEGGLGGSGLLPSTAPASYRIRPVDQALIDEPNVVHRHELDRAFVALHLAPVELTIGRQALGLGRGVLFSAVDVFAPFSPLEVDREWRRGVDAAHAELSLDEHLSADLIGAADRDFRDGALIGRLRGYLGELDAELLAGKREEDLMLGTTASAALGDAEVHGEAAWFRTDGRGLEQGWLGAERWVAKFVAGASYQFDVGRGLRVLGEYHYSGFGLRRIGDDATQLLDPAFQARLQRGDTQILGRHVFALVTSYDLADVVNANITALASPVDGSGLVGPSITFGHSDSVTLIGSAYVPWGKRPRMGLPRSEYGLSSVSGLLQARIYD